MKNNIRQAVGDLSRWLFDVYQPMSLVALFPCFWHMNFTFIFPSFEVFRLLWPTLGQECSSCRFIRCIRFMASDEENAEIGCGSPWQWRARFVPHGHCLLSRFLRLVRPECLLRLAAYSCNVEFRCGCQASCSSKAEHPYRILPPLSGGFIFFPPCPLRLRYGIFKNIESSTIMQI